MVRKELADHETTNELHSTIGNANSFHGIQRSSRMLLIGCALFCQILNCHFAGVPLCRYGSRSAVAVSVSWDNGALAAVVVAGSVRLSPLAFSGSSTLSEWIFSSLDVSVAVCRTSSLGCARCHFVSGKRKKSPIRMAAWSATFNHQKLRQPECSVMGPAMIGPTWNVVVSFQPTRLAIQT